MQGVKSNRERINRSKTKERWSKWKEKFSRRKRPDSQQYKSFKRKEGKSKKG